MRNKISELNQSFLFMLAFTIISSLIAFHLITKAYDTVFAVSQFEIAQ
ncbi:MAG: hypothetical protein WCT29_00225 [Candidatus Paceibacterota bacterium]